MKLFLWVILAAIFFLAACQTTAPSKMIALASPPVIVSSTTEASLIKEEGFLPEQVGFLVFDEATHKTTLQSNAEKGFVPASVTKIPTMLASLHILGPNYRFQTSLGYRGAIKNGVLRGDLYLKGTGDPLLTLSDLMDLVQKLKRASIKEIQGAFYFDDSTLPRKDKINDLQTEDAVYNTGISALSSEFNRLLIHWAPDLLNKVLLSYSVPSFSWLQMKLNASQDRPLPDVTFLEGSGSETWALSAYLDKEGEQALPVKDGALFTASLFEMLCRQEGISFSSEPLRRTMPKATKVLSIHESLPLSELIGKNWEFSNNLMAELVMLTAATKIAKKPIDSEKEAADVITSWLTKNVRSVQWNGFEIENGSGLSSQGRISAEQMVGVLRWSENDRSSGPSVISLLPIAGWKGSLQAHLAGPVTSLRVWAKTGTLDYARGLSGYFYSKSNKRYAFALFITDFEKRAHADQLRLSDPKSSAASANHPQAEAWLRRAKDLETALLTKWIEEL